MGAFLLTTVLAATAIASGAVYEISKTNGVRTDPVALSIAGIPVSKPAARLEQERQRLIVLASAARTLSKVSAPKLATRPARVAPAASATPGTGTPATGTAPSVPVAAPDPGTAQSIAYKMLPSFGFSAATQYGCLDDIYTRESGWRYNAENASGAYGIPQALPGSKMASAGADWATNPATQIRWGLGYIKGRYGSPCDAWAFWQGHGWY